MEPAAPLDRDAARRVLRRATELAAVEPDVVWEVDCVDARTLVVAASEVGIPEDHVLRALAVERLGPSPAHRAGDRLLGASTVVVEEELPGSAADVLARLDSWFVTGHHLRRDRLRAGRGAWRKRPGALGLTFRTVRHATGEGHLGELRRIEAAAEDTGTGTCVVRVAADRRRDRRVRAGLGAAVAAAGTCAAATAALLAGPVVLIVAPVALVAGTGLAATGRHAASEVGVELDRVLDAVDQQIKPPRLIRVFRARARF